MSRQLDRLGVVRAVEEGCAIIEVSVPCCGCSQTGCGSRRSAGRIKLPAGDARPGERMRLSLGIDALTRASLALFGPPLAWLAVSGLILATMPASSSAGQQIGAVLIGCGMVIALAAGNWLGRRAGQNLTIDQQRAEKARPVVESPVVESPVVESPVVESPVAESPVVESPVVESPVVESPVKESPAKNSAAATAVAPNSQTEPLKRRDDLFR